MQTGSQSAFARHLGVSKQMVSKHKAAGLLVMVNGQVDFAASQAAIQAAQHGSYTHQPAPEVPETLPEESGEVQTAQGRITYAEANAREKLAKAEMAEMERDLMRNKLVNAEEAARFAADLGAMFRNALEILPDRIASELVPVDDPETIRAILVEAHQNILRDIAQRIEKGFSN